MAEPVIKTDIRIPRGHMCHEVGLNPWVERCPVCGCANTGYDPDAVSDIEPDEFRGLPEGVLWRLFGL